MKKVLIVGGNGTIGSRVSNFLKETGMYEVIIAGRNSGDVNVDITDTASIKAMFEKTGTIDAVISTTGAAKWVAFDELTEEDFYIGLKSKLMGQVYLVKIGKEYVSPGGSISLTTGILADFPVLKTTSPAMVNGGIHSFVKAAALEINNGVRVNAVSVGLVDDSKEKYKDYFPGHNPVPMSKVVNAYVRAMTSGLSGEVVRHY